MLTPLALILIFFFLCFCGMVCMFYHSLRTHERAMQVLMHEQQAMRGALEHVLMLLTSQGVFDQEEDEADAPAAPAAPEGSEDSAEDGHLDDQVADAALIQATSRPEEDYLSMEPEKIPMPKPGGPDRLDL